MAAETIERAEAAQAQAADLKEDFDAGVDAAQAKLNQVKAVANKIQQNADGANDEARAAIEKNAQELSAEAQENLEKEAEEVFNNLFEDDPVFPLFMMCWSFLKWLVPRFITKLKQAVMDKIRTSIQKSPYSAIFHFLFVELFGVFAFWYLQYTTNRKLLTGLKRDIDKGELNVAAMAKKKNNEDGTPLDFKTLGTCVTATANDELWLSPSYDHHAICFLMDEHVYEDEAASDDMQRRLEEEPEDGPQREMRFYHNFGYMNVGCMGLCALVVVVCLALYSRHIGIFTKNNHGDGKYLRFCYQLPRTRAYRFVVGLLVVMTWLCLAFTSFVVIMAGQVQWLIQNFAVEFATLGVVAYRLYAIQHPKFQYNTEAFAALKFKRAGLHPSIMFANKVSSALSVAKGSHRKQVGGQWQTKALKGMMMDGEDINKAIDVMSEYVPPHEELKSLKLIGAGRKTLEESTKALESKLETLKNLSEV